MKALLQRLVAYPATGIVDVQFFLLSGSVLCVCVCVYLRVRACVFVRAYSCVRSNVNVLCSLLTSSEFVSF